MKTRSAPLLIGLALSTATTCFGQAADGFAVVSGAAGAVISNAQSAGQVIGGQSNVQPNVTGLTGTGARGASAPPTGMVVNSVPNNYSQQQPAGTMARNAPNTANTAATASSTSTTSTTGTSGNTTQCQTWTDAVQQYASNYTQGGAPNPQALRQRIPSMSDLCPPQQSNGSDGGGGGSGD